MISLKPCKIWAKIFHTFINDDQICITSTHTSIIEGTFFLTCANANAPPNLLHTAWLLRSIALWKLPLGGNERKKKKKKKTQIGWSKKSSHTWRRIASQTKAHAGSSGRASVSGVLWHLAYGQQVFHTELINFQTTKIGSINFGVTVWRGITLRDGGD